MGLSLRFYLFENDGQIKRLPINTVEKLQRGELTMPHYASSTVKLAEVILTLEDRKPVDINRVVGSLMHFDSNGSHKASGEEQSHLTEMSIRYFLGGVIGTEENGGDETVIPAEKLFTEKALNDRFRWELSPEEIKRLIEFIWPVQPETPKKKKTHLKLVKR